MTVTHWETAALLAGQHQQDLRRAAEQARRAGSRTVWRTRTKRRGHDGRSSRALDR